MVRPVTDTVPTVIVSPVPPKMALFPLTQVVPAPQLASVVFQVLVELDSR